MVGWICNPEFENIPKPAVNTDFIRYEYGGCVYAAFILSLLNFILVAFLFKEANFITHII